MRADLLLLVAACRHTPAPTDTTAPVDSAETDTDTDTDTDSDADADADTDADADADADVHDAGRFGGVGHVLWLVPDGTRADESIFDGMSSASHTTPDEIVPALRNLLFPQGTVIRPGLSTGITVTDEAHATMLTGTRVTQANYPSFDGPGHYRPELPTLFEVLRAEKGYDADAVTFIANYKMLDGHTYSLYPNLGEAFGTEYIYLSMEDTPEGGDPEDMAEDDGVVFDALQERLQERDLRFALVNLHWIDGAAHTGDDAAPYIAALGEADNRLVDLWDWIQATPPYKNDTLLVIAADHGRHRQEDVRLDYKDHGDQCAGCRQIPMLILGPGVIAGQELDIPYTLEDLSRTVAWSLGLDLPYGSGLVMKEIFETTVTDPGRSGETWPVISGELTANELYTSDPAHPVQVMIGDEIRSTSTAMLAERPRVLAAGNREYACWRELFTEDVEYSYHDFPWLPNCETRTSGGEWEAMGFPDTQYSPYFEAGMATDRDGERLWLVYPDNPLGVWRHYGDCSTHLVRWTAEGGWESPESGAYTSVLLPLDPQVVVRDDGLAFVAFGTSVWTGDDDADETGRYTRHVEVHAVDWPDGGDATWTLVWTVEVADGDDLAGSPNPLARVEHPALASFGERLYLAAVAYGDTIGNEILFTQSPLDGAPLFPGYDLVDGTGRVVGWVPPRWGSDGRLYYARAQETGDLEICAFLPVDSSVSCVDAGTVGINGISPFPDGVRASVVGPDNAWTVKDFAW